MAQNRFLQLIPAIILAVCVDVSAVWAGGEVVVYNWSEYMPDDVLRQFKDETGIKVIYSTYDSNEAMYAKVKLLGAKGYDVVVPSTYFVNKMRGEGLLAPLDKSKLSNLKHLDPSLLDKPYDPQNRYSVPYMWGGTGIIVDAAKIDPATITSWSDLWKPEFKGQLLLQDDLREVFGMALLLKGYSLNATEESQIKDAYDLVVKLVPNVRLFNSDNPKLPFLNQEVAIGMIWNGEAFQAAEENDKLTFIWPKEGGIFWTDCLCIPKNASNTDNAHAFINFLMKPEIAVAIAGEIGYAIPNKTALAMMPESVKTNSTAYPPAAVISTSEFQNDIGEAVMIYEKYWEMLKVGE